MKETLITSNGASRSTCMELWLRSCIPALRTPSSAETHSSSLIVNPWVGTRVRLSLFFVVGVLAAVAHDRFYTFLDGKAGDGGIFKTIHNGFSDSETFSDQSVVNIFANIITKVGGGSLAAAVSVAFVQLFWARITRRPTRLSDIDRLTNFARNPFDLVSWPVALSIRSLTAVIVIGALMEFISVITPGALTVEFVTSNDTCVYTIVDLFSANSTVVNVPSAKILEPKVPTSGLVARTLMAGTYVPPQSFCDICEYDVEFLAPALQCINVTSSTNFSRLSTSPLGVWSAQSDRDVTAHPPEEPNQVLNILSRNLLGDSLQSIPQERDCPVVALNCSGWIAEYQVHVKHNFTSTAVVRSVTLKRPFLGEELEGDPPLPLPDSQIIGFWRAFLDTMIEEMALVFFAGAEGAQLTWNYGGSSPWLAWSALNRGAPDMPWQWPWPSDLSVTVPDLMKNISLSLLAGTNTGFPAIATNSTPCLTSSLQYVYRPARLLGTYGAGLALAAVCVALGFYARRSSPRSESLDFSRILAAYPVGGQLLPEDLVVAGQDGRLVSP